MKSKKGTLGGTIGLIILILMIITLVGFLAYENIKNEELKEFILFQVEYSTYITEKCDMNYSVELDNFLRYKVDELLNKSES